MILDRVEADRKDSVPDEVTFAKVTAVLLDPISWAFGAYCSCFQKLPFPYRALSHIQG